MRDFACNCEYFIALIKLYIAGTRYVALAEKLFLFNTK